MKHIFIIFAALFLFVACGTQSDEFNSLSSNGLKGNVMSVKTMCYYAKERFGEAEKLRMLYYYHSNYQLPLFPAYSLKSRSLIMISLRCQVQILTHSGSGSPTGQTGVR